MNANRSSFLEKRTTCLFKYKDIDCRIKAVNFLFFSF